MYSGDYGEERTEYNGYNGNRKIIFRIGKYVYEVGSHPWSDNEIVVGVAEALHEKACD